VGGWVPGHLRITGKKRRARDRLVPFILTEINAPLLGPAGFLSALRRARLGVSAYGARRSFARWMEEAGILETHQQAYLGHGPRTITDLYRRAELAAA
jgi:integrase